MQLIVLALTCIMVLHSAWSDPLQTRQFLKDANYTGQTLLPVIIPLETTGSILKSPYHASNAPILLKDDSKLKNRKDYLNAILQIGSLNDKTMTSMTKTQITMLTFGCYGPFTSNEMKFLQNYGSEEYWGLRAILLQSMQDRDFADAIKLPGFASGAQSSHSMCSCLKDFATRTDMQGKIPKSSDEFDHQTGLSLSDCQLQDLVYQATDNATTLEHYLSDDNTAMFDHAKQVQSNAAMNALFKAINPRPAGLFANSTIQEFLQHLRTINPASYNRQFHNYLISSSDVDENWFEYSETAGISTCMHHAVPIYVSSVEEYLGVQVHYKFGEHLLLVAVLIGIYFMSVEIRKQLKEYVKETATGTPPTDWNYKFVDYSNTVQRYLSGFLIFAILIIAVLVLVNVAFEIEGGENKAYWRAIFGSVESDVLSLQIIGVISLLLWVVLVLTFFAIAGCEYYRGRNENVADRECTVVVCMMFDICVLLGSAHIAITMSVLRGITSSESILLTFLLVLTIGLLQHFSNLSMFVLQIANAFNAQVSSRKVALHRFAHAVLSALILYCVYALASTTFASSTVDLIQSQTSNFIFLLGLFFILHGYDIWVEVAVHFNTMKNPETARKWFTNKHYANGILIVFLLLILNIQRFLFLCGKEEMHESGETVCKRPFEYIFGPTSNERNNHFYGG